MERKELIFATGNNHKVMEVQSIMGDNYIVVPISSIGFTGEIPETGTTLQENALQKARHIWNLYSKPCFADDTGLEIDALGGAPGVYSARYATTGHDFLANCHKVLTNMAGQSNRAARFKCVIAYIDACGKEHLFTGNVEGEILHSMDGDGGFGYDPLFRPLGYSKSFAQLGADIKNAISHRGKALQLFKEYLTAQQL